MWRAPGKLWRNLAPQLMNGCLHRSSEVIELWYLQSRLLFLNQAPFSRGWTTGAWQVRQDCRAPHLDVIFLSCILRITLLVPLSVVIVIGVLGCSFGELQPESTSQTT